VSTHRQALAALLFFYGKVLCTDLPWLQEIGRPRPSRRLPVVLTPDEVVRILGFLEGEHRLFAQLLYGTGMRISEGLQLRVGYNILGLWFLGWGCRRCRPGRWSRPRFRVGPGAHRRRLVGRRPGLRRWSGLVRSRWPLKTLGRGRSFSCPQCRTRLLGGPGGVRHGVGRSRRNEIPDQSAVPAAVVLPPRGPAPDAARTASLSRAGSRWLARAHQRQVRWCLPGWWPGRSGHCHEHQNR